MVVELTQKEIARLFCTSRQAASHHGSPTVDPFSVHLLLFRSIPQNLYRRRASCSLRLCSPERFRKGGLCSHPRESRDLNHPAVLFALQIGHQRLALHHLCLFPLFSFFPSVDIAENPAHVASITGPGRCQGPRKDALLVLQISACQGNRRDQLRKSLHPLSCPLHPLLANRCVDHQTDSIHATSPSDLTPRAYAQHLAALAAPKPLTEREKALAEVRAAEYEASKEDSMRGTGGGVRGGAGPLSGVMGVGKGLVWGEGVEDALNGLKEGGKVVGLVRFSFLGD